MQDKSQTPLMKPRNTKTSLEQWFPNYKLFVCVTQPPLPPLIPPSLFLFSERLHKPSASHTGAEGRDKQLISDSGGSRKGLQHDNVVYSVCIVCSEEIC